MSTQPQMNNTGVEEGAEPSVFKSIKNDIPASIVVFLVALPLCMGIAIASGMPPATGLVTGIIGGLVVGFLSGAPLQVSGPAAGLSVMVFEVVQRRGFEVLGVIVIVCGLVQLLSGILRFGQWFRAVSPAVIRGMLAGIGILIFASQFHVMVDDSPRSTGLANLLSVPEAIYKGIFPVDGSTHHHAALIGMLTIVTLIAWKPLVPRFLKTIPAPLMAVVIASVATAVLGYSIKLVDLPDNMMEAITLPTLGDFALLRDGQILLAGLAMAFVASAETLLCATAVDQMKPDHRTKYDKELFAQGVGNTICGFLGALPMTGVIVRSSANVDAGGKTRFSAILHGAWLILFVAFLPFILAMIPTAGLAAILVYTGWKLMDFKSIGKLAEFGKGEVIIYVATVSTIVIADLLTGVLVGIILSAVKLLYRFSHLDMDLEYEAGSRTAALHLRGAATFVRLPMLAKALEKAPPETELHVHFEHLDYIDHACLELLHNTQKQHESAGGSLIIDWDELNHRYHREPAALQKAKVAGKKREAIDDSPPSTEGAIADLAT